MAGFFLVGFFFVVRLARFFAAFLRLRGLTTVTVYFFRFAISEH
jgi:hypothetical protein